MQADLMMVIGVTVIFFAIPAFVSAWSDREAPRFAALSAFLGTALCFYATTVKPGGFPLSDVPMAFVNVVAQILR